jgi:hypothetical protein
MYFTVASGYLLSVTLFYVNLKIISPDTAERRKKRIFAVSVSVGLIFYLRAILNLIRGIITFDVGWEKRAWKENDIWFPIYRVIYFIIVDILPISFMLQSAKTHIDNRSISIHYSLKRGETDGVQYDEVSDIYTQYEQTFYERASQDRTTINE